MRRALSLKKETLVELSPHELGEIAGGALTPECPTFEYCRIPTDHCRIPTDHCRSLLDCLSLLIDPCIPG